MMEFIYPRRITISRPNQDNTVGTIGYQGVLPSNETVLFTNIPASIQKKSGIKKPIAGLPADVTQGYAWNIFVWLSFLPKNAVKNNDIITDDLGSRYQVYANYWNSLGFNMTCERLEN
jgi:hypothetical protein